MESIVLYVVLGVAGLLTLITLFMSFFTVAQQSVAVVTRFGKFARVAKPGLNFKTPWLEWVSGQVDLRVQQMTVDVETKTQDNVFVRVKVAVQYYILEDKVYEAFYKLSHAGKQIESFVYDVVRAQVPKMKLDEVFEKKDDVANAVKSELAQAMDDFGYGILKAPVTDIDPDGKVKEAMNEINAAQRLRVAANEKGEAEKILQVKKAEAEAQSKALQGKGIADQRRAIVEGLRESVAEFQEGVPDATARDVMNLVMMTQFFDTMKDIGASSHTNTVFMNNNPGALGELMNQIQSSILVGDRANTGTDDAASADLTAAAKTSAKR